MDGWMGGWTRVQYSLLPTPLDAWFHVFHSFHLQNEKLK
jgi:hypothetical protein